MAQETRNVDYESMVDKYMNECKQSIFAVLRMT